MASRKIIAIVIVVVILLAAAAVILMSDDDYEEGTTILARVNTDGSAIYVKEGVNIDDYVSYSETEPTSGYYLGAEGKWVVFNKDAWGGSVFGVPAPSSIQYVQLLQIADLMGLKYVLYNGTETSSDTLYYISGVNSYDSFESTLINNPEMIGAINWEPQCSVAVIKGCTILATTNDMFPGHSCCIVGATNDFLSNNSDLAVRFLAAYIQTVDKMNSVIASGSGDDYEYLIQVAINNVALSNMTDEEKRQTIISSFSLDVYTYEDANADPNNPLASLKADVAELAQSMYDAEQIRYTYSDLGFESNEALAEAFVDDSYLKSAKSFTKTDYDEPDTIRVGVIAGDIHQLAIHYGIALGIFAEYGINIELTSESAGPTVYNLLHVGEVDIGLLGAPPMTINGINNKEIIA